MDIRPVREDELPTLVDELWTPFIRELLADDPRSELAEGFREDALGYRREQLATEAVWDGSRRTVTRCSKRPKSEGGRPFARDTQRQPPE